MFPQPKFKKFSKSTDYPILPPAWPEPSYHVDITGLNPVQKNALENAWFEVQKGLEIHARGAMLHFFERYPDYLIYFDFETPENRRWRNRNLHEHATKVFESFTYLIVEGLYDAERYEEILEEFVVLHDKRGILLSIVEYRRIMDSIVDYLIGALGRFKAVTLEEAIRIFFGRVMEAFEKYESEKSAFEAPKEEIAKVADILKIAEVTHEKGEIEKDEESSLKEE